MAVCVCHQIEIENHENFCSDSSEYIGANRVGFIIGLFYLLMDTGSASQMLFACNREVEFNGLSRTGFVVTYLCLITEAESGEKSSNN